jgi:hypothetical protein
LESPRVNPEIEAHLRMSVNFPSPPGVATHIIELAQDPDIEMGKVAKALSMDSALSTKILRIANSPLYAQRRKSENLRQALVVLGLNATLTLALSFSLVKSLRGGKPNGLNYGLYWRRASVHGQNARPQPFSALRSANIRSAFPHRLRHSSRAPGGALLKGVSCRRGFMFWRGRLMSSWT